MTANGVLRKSKCPLSMSAPQALPTFYLLLFTFYLLLPPWH
jgi:hypothetical protein